MYYTFANNTLETKTEKELAKFTRRMLSTLHNQCTSNKYVNKTDMQTIIEDAAQGSELLYIEFKKKDGDLRQMYCVPTNKDEMGRKLVIDVEVKFGLTDEDSNNPYRKVDLREIQRIDRMRTNTTYVRK